MDNTGAYQDTFVCRAAISPQYTSILSIAPLRSRIVLAPVMPCTGWFAIKSQESIAMGAVELMVMFIFQKLALQGLVTKRLLFDL